MRTSLACVIGLSCMGLACTMPNPEFDTIAGDSGTDDQSSMVDTSADAEAEASTEAGEDLPDPLACEYVVSDGLALQLGDPAYFGNTCPNSISSWARIDAAEGGEVTLSFCSEGCEGCVGAHPFSAFPMTITDYLPAPSEECVVVQTKASFGNDGHACFWGAISLHEPETNKAIFIGTAHSSELTPFGVEFLAGQIPEPLKGGSCNCDAVGQSNECCYSAPNAPEFWYYPFGDTYVNPGGAIQLAGTNAEGLFYYFKLFQAQRLYGCEFPDLQLSWAVVAR